MTISLAAKKPNDFKYFCENLDKSQFSRNSDVILDRL